MSPINEHNKIPVEGFFIELANGRIDEKTLDDGTLEISFSKQVTTKGGDDSIPPPDE